MAVSQDFLAFFSFMTRTHKGSNKHAKMFLLKDSFLHRDICKISYSALTNKPHRVRLLADQHCVDSDSALTNTVRSHKIKFAEIQNRLTLCGVGIRADKHCVESDSALTNNARSQTLP